MDSWQTLVQGITVILLLTSFVKLATALSIFRFGLGLDGAVFGIVVFALALALTLPVMLPEIERAGGVDQFLHGTSRDGASLESRFRPYLQKHTDAGLAQKFQALAEKSKARPQPGDPATWQQADGAGAERVAADQPRTETETANQAAPARAEGAAAVEFPVLIAAFLVSELRVALTLGLIFLIPFFLVDLLVSVALGALDLQNVSQQIVAVPLKLLLFFVIDGWALITTKLLTYGQ